MTLDSMVPTHLRVFAWATPAEGVTLDQLIAEFEEAGNTVLEVDRPNNRLKMIDVTEEL